MKDNQTYDTCKYHLQAAREHFASLTKKVSMPSDLQERLTEDLKSIEEFIMYEEVVIRISDVQVRRDNTYNQRHSTVFPNFRSDGDDLDLGFNIDEYCVRTRHGFQIRVNEHKLSRYCERFGLYKEFGVSKFVDMVKFKLEREPMHKRRRKPLAEGEEEKTRPRVFKEVENAKKLIEKSLLTLKLVEPLAGIEAIPENYVYDA